MPFHYGEFDRWPQVYCLSNSPNPPGRFDCVGRRLALNVLRLTIAYTLWHYDFQFAPGEDGKRFEEEAKFQLIVKPADLHCVFTKRSETEV